MIKNRECVIYCPFNGKFLRRDYCSFSMNSDLIYTDGVLKKRKLLVSMHYEEISERIGNLRVLDDLLDIKNAAEEALSLFSSFYVVPVGAEVYYYYNMIDALDGCSLVNSISDLYIIPIKYYSEHGKAKPLWSHAIKFTDVLDFKGNTNVLCRV